MAAWLKLALLGLIGIGALVYVFAGSDSDERAYRTPSVADSRQEPIAEFNRAKYADGLQALKGGAMISKIEKGLSDHGIRLTASRRWQAQGEQARLQSARALWKAWAKLYPPDQRYRARIVIVDERGSKIGGSRLLNAAKIWVRK